MGPSSRENDTGEFLPLTPSLSILLGSQWVDLALTLDATRLGFGCVSQRVGQGTTRTGEPRLRVGVSGRRGWDRPVSEARPDLVTK